MKRKIVSIATLSMDNDVEGTYGEVVAVADDGTLWKGGMKCLNLDQVKAFYAQAKVGAPTTKVMTAPAYEYGWVWEQLPALPDDNSNLTKRR